MNSGKAMYLKKGVVFTLYAYHIVRLFKNTIYFSDNGCRRFVPSSADSVPNFHDITVSTNTERAARAKK